MSIMDSNCFKSFSLTFCSGSPPAMLVPECFTSRWSLSFSTPMKEGVTYVPKTSGRCLERLNKLPAHLWQRSEEDSNVFVY